MAWFVSAIGAAAAAFGTAEFVGLALVATAETGMAMSVVGTMTGSKDLTKAGAILGLAGGLGSIATSSFGAASAAGAVGSEDAITAGLTADAATTGGAVGGGATAAEQVANTAANAGDSVTNAASNASNFGPSSTPVGDALSNASTLNIPNAPGVTSPNVTNIATGPTAGVTGSATPAVVDAPAGIVNAGAATPNNLSAAQNAADEFGMGSSGSKPGLDSLASVSGPSATDTGSLWETLKNTSIGKAISSMPPVVQAELMKSALAVPGGIQAQKNKAAELALSAQRIGQTSYGSQVPTTGIISAPPQAVRAA